MVRKTVYRDSMDPTISGINNEMFYRSFHFSSAGEVELELFRKSTWV